MSEPRYSCKLPKLLQDKESILSFLTSLYNEQGVGALFQGLGPELTRGVLSSALMLMIKEQIASLVHASLYGNQHNHHGTFKQ